MALLKNNEPQAQTPSSSNSEKPQRAPRDRFILGDSECYFEPAEYMTGKLNATKVKSLFTNEAMSLEETQGRSLKVHFRTDNEVKFVGFVTAGDASIELDSEDVPTVMQHAVNGTIVEAIKVDDLVALF